MIEVLNGFRAVVDQCSTSIIVQRDERVVYINRAALDCLGFNDDSEAIGRPLGEFLDANSYATLASNFTKSSADDDQLFVGDLKLRRKSGSLIDAEVYHAGLRFEGGDATTINFRDLTATKRMELDLRQAQKLESMGRLAAGIAHEINTPIQYVGDSVHYLGQAITDILSLLDKSRADLRTLAAQRGGAAAVAELAREEEAVDLEYLRREGPLAVERIVDGISRVARIVHAMKTFSHPGSDSAIPMDINKMVENTLIIAGHELKSVGRVATELAELPQVSGFPADINQALLNLVVNAAHAVADRGDPASPGVVTVGTRANQGYVEITVADNGCGMTPEVQARLFEPFFTTKEVGRGTGQGLGVARAAAQKHDGAISFVSSVDVGTTFTLRLPIEGTT